MIPIKKYGKILFTSLLLVLAFDCSDLTEKYNANLTSSQVGNSSSDITAMFVNLTNAVRDAFQNPTGGVVPLSELTTDELIAPARGTNWYDNGIWIQLHQHQWNPDLGLITSCFNALNGVSFAATDLLRFNLAPDQKAVARFYRAWAMYWVLDLFDQVPYRAPNENTLTEARVMQGSVALDSIIREVKVIMRDLPDGQVSTPSKNAARVFLMKCYLNRAVYVNRTSPSFERTDMNNVISYADTVLNSGQYSFSDNYFDNFGPDNTSIGKENIFTIDNIGGALAESYLFLYTIIPLHYKSTPFGANGWATLSNFYNNFISDDLRRGQAYRSTMSPPNSGNRIDVGFLRGQQYNLYTDSALTNGPGHSGVPLVFTDSVHLFETGINPDIPGIRPIKYPVDYVNVYNCNPVTGQCAWGNDWVFFRLPDVLLMKAEAILRGGANTTGPYGSSPLDLINSVRTHPSRGTRALTSLDLPTLLDERGRELWLECWRRQDMIRFGTFLKPFQQKEYQSDPCRVVFPIPSQQRAVNHNYKQDTPCVTN
jgi:hypothetical protein